MLTSKELWVIEAIVSNEFSGNNYRLPSHTESYDELKSYNGDCCWANSIEDNGAKHGTPCSGKEISGVIASLVKKGFVFGGDVKKFGRDATIAVTRKGWEAYQEVMNEPSFEELIEKQKQPKLEEVSDMEFLQASMQVLGSQKVVKIVNSFPLKDTTKEMIQIKICEEVAKAMLLNQLECSETDVLRKVQVVAYKYWVEGDK